MATTAWLMILTLGGAALGLALFWGISRNRARSPAERQLTEAATRQEYRAEEKDAS